MNDLMREAAGLLPYMVDIRRALHRFPELGNQEYKTAQRIEAELHQLGICCSHIAGTGLVGLLEGGSDGATIAFRADMDALPVQEQTALPYRSETDGQMHACGHDMHVAALLGAAKLLSAHREALHGNVKFFFQPDEEGSGGAQRMIDEGCMRNPDVEAVFGAHVAPELPSGQIGLRYGSAYAASNPFDIVIHGKGAHGAEPQNGVDAIAIACAVVQALQTIVSREIAPTETAVLSVCSFHAGTSCNVLADTAKLSGILRCYGSVMRARLTRRLTELVQGIASSMNGVADITIHESYSGIVNDDTMVDRVRAAATELLGPAQIVLESAPSLTTEDFGAFIEAATGCFFHIGAGHPGQNNAPLHNPHFNPDESALTTASALYAQIALNCLKA